MKLKFYLHIGMNKTGTSAIQRFLNQNRKQLINFGLLYPVTGCNGEAHYALSRAFGFDHASVFKMNQHSAGLLEIHEKLMDEIESSSVSNVVMSSENFVLPHDVNPVWEFFKDYDVRIVIYFRRHDDWWKSAYNQAVKMVESPPWGRSFSAFVKFQKNQINNYGHYRVLIERWAGLFGKENIIIRPYEKQQNEPDIVSDFLYAIDQGAIVKKMDIFSERTNEGLSYDALNLVDIFQRIDVTPEIRSKLLQYAISLPMNNDSVFSVDPEVRRQLIDENLVDYEYIAREFLGREDGRLFYDDLPAPDEVWSPPKHPTFMKVVEETINALMK